MRFCRSLSENDEMLRILRAMQFWVLLMVQVPERIAAERQRLEQILADFLKALREIRQSIAIHQAQLDQRLVQLPAQIAEGINPEAIAAKINESLRQQFVQSTIPATAEALTVAAAQMKKATSKFARSASTLVTECSRKQIKQDMFY
jgi:response regulator of citrate/malate metabolism